MEKRLHELEQKVEELSKTVDQLRARLDAQPARPAQVAVRVPFGADAEPVPLPDALKGIDPDSARSAVPLVGRSLMMIAGAFVFRLITERELVTRPVGVTLGLAFAALQVFLAWRDAGTGRRLSGAFHSAVGALIGFALLLEMGSRSGLASPPLVALVLATFTGLLLATSWRHRLPEVAWMAELGCLAAGAGLLRATDTPLPFFVVLATLGLASVVFAEFRQWPHLRWPVALFLDLAALRLVFSLSARPEAEQGALGAIVLVTQGVIGVYVLALFLGTWLRDHPVRAFEVVQTAVVLTVGLLTITRVHGAAGPWGLLVATGALVTAIWLASLERTFDSWFFGVLGMALTFASGPLVLGGPALGVFWASVGLGLAALGRGRMTPLLWGGAAVLGWAGTVPGGTLELILSGLLRAPAGEWARLTPIAAALVGLALASWALMTVRLKDRAEAASRFLAMTLLALVVLGGVALGAHGARALLGGEGAAAGLVILLRTLSLCGAAVGLAFARRLGGPIEFSWAAWGALVLGGGKVLVQDLPNGQAGSLVVAFLALGLAITAVPRLLRAGT
ncbi:MAG: hypothetical protein Q8L48_20035 [Archangium sp.]|nr:hypothetical protein [Archangium sp.]